MNELPKRCVKVQDQLPDQLAGELSRRRAWAVRRHVSRCAVCTAEQAAQQEVAERLARLGAVSDTSLEDVAPPPELLATLLAQAEEPTLRQRVAVPARGAVSGARPGLSVALLALVATLCVLAGWAGWQLGRSWAEGRRSVE